MIKKLLSISIVFTFLLDPLLEAKEISSSKKTQESVSVSTILNAPDCDHCENDGCSTGECCSTSLCSCGPTTLLKTNDNSFTYSILLVTKVDWYFFNDYLSPFLHPALKPPLFS